MSERDTHFANFARMLYDDFLQLARDDKSSAKELMEASYPEKWRAKVEQLIARRAFDLVCHALTHTTPCTFETGESPESIISEDIPDMAAWPEKRNLSEEKAEALETAHVILAQHSAPRQVSLSFSCGECHADIHGEWETAPPWLATCPSCGATYKIWHGNAGDEVSNA